MLAELIGILIIALSVVYIYYKYVLFNFWRKKGVFYVEPVVPAGNVTAFVIGKISVGKYYIIFLHSIVLTMHLFMQFSLFICCGKYTQLIC